MTTVVDLQIRNIDLADEDVLDCLAEMDNISLETRSGLGILTVFVDAGQDVVHAVTDAAHLVSTKIPGVVVVRVHPDLVTASEIAQRVGVSREAVRKWTHSTKVTFPVQFDNLGAGQKVWRWVEVVTWLKASKQIDMDEDLPTVEQIAEIDSCLAGVLDQTSREWKEISSPTLSNESGVSFRLITEKSAQIEYFSPNMDRKLSLESGMQNAG